MTDSNPDQPKGPYADQSEGSIPPHGSNQDPYRSSAEFNRQRAYQRGYATGRMKQKFQDTYKSIKDSRHFNDMLVYAKTNKHDTITYIALALAIIICYFNPLAGSLLMGFIAGFFFADEIYSVVLGMQRGFTHGINSRRYIVLAILLIYLLFAIPGFIIGAALAVAFTLFLR